MRGSPFLYIKHIERMALPASATNWKSHKELMVLRKPDVKALAFTMAQDFPALTATPRIEIQIRFQSALLLESQGTSQDEMGFRFLL